jgi:hypothetical protein
MNSRSFEWPKAPITALNRKRFDHIANSPALGPDLVECHLHAMPGEVLAQLYARAWLMQMLLVHDAHIAGVGPRSGNAGEMRRQVGAGGGYFFIDHSQMPTAAAADLCCK